MKKINILFMTLVALTAQYGVASDDVSRHSPYQVGIEDMLTPHISVVALSQLTVEYVGKSEFEEHWEKSKSSLKALTEQPDMYVNSLDVNTKDKNGRPLLHTVIFNNNVPILKKFLELKPNINAVDEHGQTALFSLAPEDFTVDAILLLLNAGINVDIQNQDDNDVIQHWSRMGAACAFKRHDAVIVVEKLFEKHKQKARTSQTKTPQLQLKSIKVQDLLSELTIVSKKK